MAAAQQRRSQPNTPPIVVRAQAVFFAGLFAFVLPFICWGAWAQPCHPHSRPHFVFLPPILTTSVAGPHSPCAATAPLTMAMPMTMDEPVPDSQTARDAAAAEMPATSAGRSTPSMSLAVFSLIMLLTAICYRFYMQWEERFAATLLRTIQHLAYVPTPPPRLTSM